MNTDPLTQSNFPSDKAEKAIGYIFKDKNLLITAFTRSSYANEHGVLSNERLEFLGDSVLGLIASEYLYSTGSNEGSLTESKKKMVSSKPLSLVCEKKEYYRYLIMSKGDKKGFSLSNKHVLEDLVEALVGAIYLDGGYECAKRFVCDNIFCDMDATNAFSDYVSVLKEYCEKSKIGIPEYRYTDISTKEQKTFITEIYLNDGLIAKEKADGAISVSKQNAACSALNNLKRKEK